MHSGMSYEGFKFKDIRPEKFKIFPQRSLHHIHLGLIVLCIYCALYCAVQCSGESVQNWRWTTASVWHQWVRCPCCQDIPQPVFSTQEQLWWWCCAGPPANTVD